MTEKQKLEYRIRNWNSVESSDNASVKGDSKEVRLRYFYNHGNLGDSKVNYTSRIQYRDKADETQDLEYMAKFNFADYMFNTDLVKTTDFTVAPRYAYVWGENSSVYDNQVGVDLYTMHELPWGFSFEFNLYTTQHFFGERAEILTEDGKEDKNFTIDMEAYIYNTTNLYTNGNVSVDFNFEGGYDQYNWSKEKIYGETNADHSKYSLYALPTIQLNYQATPNLTTYVAAGAEYRNWNKEHESCASDWRWQPTVFAGFKTTF